jgi:lipid II:glycine glycyltransferase (peptidoglycan interpeptide bridge formation enzyme)
MQVTFSTDKQQWESAVSQFTQANFLQSWQWGIFQESLGKKVIRLLVSDGENIGLAQMVIETAKRGTYAAVSGGPLINWQDSEFVKQFFTVLTDEAHKQNCVFIRFRSQALESEVSTQLLTNLQARLAPMHLTADLTLQLDLTHSDEELLNQMRKNTRYEVRKAEKLGITTRVTTDVSEMEDFYKEQLAVAKRHNFVPFSYAFLKNQFAAFAMDDQVMLIHSFSGEQLLASAFVIFYNKEAVYHYGVSTEANAKLPGSYAVQWRAIQEAKNRGCSRYNFWGIAPEGAKDHRFAGVSLFKRGFGGNEVAYLPAHDIVLSPFYWVTWVFEIVRKKLRRL